MLCLTPCVLCDTEIVKNLLEHYFNKGGGEPYIVVKNLCPGETRKIEGCTLQLNAAFTRLESGTLCFVTGFHMCRSVNLFFGFPGFSAHRKEIIIKWYIFVQCDTIYQRPRTISTQHVWHTISFNFHDDTMESYDYFCILHTRKLWLIIVYHVSKVSPGLDDCKVPDSSRISPVTSL